MANRFENLLEYFKPKLSRVEGKIDSDQVIKHVQQVDEKAIQAIIDKGKKE